MKKKFIVVIKKNRSAKPIKAVLILDKEPKQCPPGRAWGLETQPTVKSKRKGKPCD